VLEALKQEPIVPFNTTTAYRFVPWIIALMVCLAILALSTAASVNVMVNAWQQNHKELTTITLSENDFSELPLETRRQRVLEILKNSNQVASVDVISRENVPLIVSGPPKLTLPIKSLDFEIQPHLGQFLNAKSLSNRFDVERLGARVSNFQQERDVIFQIAHSVLWISTLLATLIGFAAIATIAFITHSGLEAHQRVINILNIVGAQNHFIAKQFQRHALILSCKGGFIGAGFAVVILGVISVFMPDMDLLGLTLSWPFGVMASIMLLTPMGVMALASFSAHLTVLSTLTKSQGQSKFLG